MPPFAKLSIWITSLVGDFTAVDELMSLLACDFFVPVTMSLVLLFLWFGQTDPLVRRRNQWGVMCASASLGFANLAVWILNHVIVFDPWLRPFETYASARDATVMLFYFPVDPSFPSNPAASSFAAAMGMWFYSHKASIPLFILAFLWSFARVYVGVHYPLDILGGAVIGVVIAYITYRFIKVVNPLPRFFLWLARKFYLA